MKLFGDLQFQLASSIVMLMLQFMLGSLEGYEETYKREYESGLKRTTIGIFRW